MEKYELIQDIFWKKKRQRFGNNFHLGADAKEGAKNNSQVLIILVNGDATH